MNYEMTKKEITIGNEKFPIMYTLLKDLPSGKRSYLDMNEIYVRGLFYGEVVELSKINEESLEDTLKIYRNAIILDKYQLEDLELIDYILLTSIVNIMTTPNFKWYPTFKCDNDIINPKLTQLKLEKEGLEDTIENIEKEIDKEKDPEKVKNLKDNLIKLKEKLKSIEDKISNFDEDVYVKCNANVSSPITLDDFEVEIKDPNVEVPNYYKLKFLDKELELELKPLTIKDMIELENNDDEIAFLAKHIKNIPFDQAYNLIKMSFPWEVENLRNEIERFNIELKPIIARCPRCGKEYEVYIDLKNFKVLPRF